MKNILLISMALFASVSFLSSEIDTSSLDVTTSNFGDIEELQTYCQRKCLDDGACVEKCMNLTLINEIPT